MLFSKSYTKQSDEELMGLLQRGEERALVQLYERYSKKLLRYFHRMLWRNEARAQDFLQDLFMKVIEQPQLFNPNRKFSTWLYSVAHNMCKNEYRKQKLRPSAEQNNIDPSYIQLIPEAMDGVKFKVALEEALNLFEEDYKTIFVLRYEMEMSVKEISVIMDVPEGSVKSKLFYLRKNLSERLVIFNPLKSKAL